MPNWNEDDLLNIREAEDYTGLRHQSIYPAVHAGKLRAEKIRPYLFRRSDLDRWMAGRGPRKGPLPRRAKPPG